MKPHSHSDRLYTETHIIDNIYVFNSGVFQKTVGILIDTYYYATLLTDFLLNSYETDFIQSLLKRKEEINLIL